MLCDLHISHSVDVKLLDMMDMEPTESVIEGEIKMREVE